LAEAFDEIPKGLDVLITHTPPFGKGDRAPQVPEPLTGQLNDYRHIGSRELLRAIHRVKPRLVVYGHVHADGGWRMRLNETAYANVSVLDEAYRPARPASEPLLPAAP
jgi:Icc-related predicted phosphoesterase